MAGSAPSCRLPGPLLTNQIPPAPAELGWGRGIRSLPTLPGREILHCPPAVGHLPSSSSSPTCSRARPSCGGAFPHSPRTPPVARSCAGLGSSPRPLMGTRHRATGPCQSKGPSPLCQPWVWFSLDWCLQFDGSAQPCSTQPGLLCIAG